MRTDTKQEALSIFVDREVYANVSYLVSELAAEDKYIDELMPLLERQPDREDYIDAIENAADPKIMNMDWMRVLDIDELRELAKKEDIEVEPTEVFEHWIVSDWLARKLEVHGESVTFDFMGLTIWGRACTGQAIFMDGVIEDIYDEINA